MKVAINGFGRIGRLAFRRMQEIEGLEVVGINDLGNNDMLAHLLKYDSTQGRFNGEVAVEDNAFVINGKKIPTFEEPDPAKLPWGELGVDVVLECTGFFNDTTKAQAHIDAGAKKVLLSAPGKGEGLKTIVYNVNHEILTGDETIVSGASCTTNCLAPMVDTLNKEFGVVEGIMTTIHAYTGDQNTLDAPHRKGDKRRARAAAVSIIPNSTGAAKAIGEVIPELKGKLDGSAQRVPVATGSLTELITVLEKEVTVDEINAAMKAAANESYGYTEDEIVSADIIGIAYGSLFDATQTRIVSVGDKQLVKTVAWYDNEMSYTCQLIRTLVYMGKLAK